MGVWRRRRRAVRAAAARWVLAGWTISAGTAAVVSGCGSVSGPPPAASSPSTASPSASSPASAGTGQAPTSALPRTVLPSPAELFGAGWRAAGSAASGWPSALPQCVLYDAAEYPAQRHRVAVRAQRYVGGVGRAVTVTVERFAPGWAARSMDDVRRVLETCARYEYSDEQTEFLDSHTVTAMSSVGDESLLVESTRIAPPDPAALSHTAVVRRGDLVATVAGSGVPASEMGRLAGRLAARL